MLEPRSRRLLLDALRPPHGYQLDQAVGSSFSLDLLALMTAPLAFTFFDWEDAEGRPTADPLALLEAVRRHADRITLFCQTGRIAVPGSGRLLLAHLEGSVFEAAAPKDGGLFHPKVWVLRYTRQDEPVRYRLLCLSRNLTFDRSWDTALVLDGRLENRKRAFAINHPLGDFVAALPGLAIREVPATTRAAIEQISDEIRRVRFELPDGFEEVAFHPLGIDRQRRWPFPDPEASRRMLVVSPFLGGPLLARIANGRNPGVLISRPESLAELEPAVLERFERVLVLSPEADPEDSEEETEELAGAPEPAHEAEQPAAELLSGLHAKLFVMDDGHKARLWTGSANATAAAFEQNVEFLVELMGKRGHCGIAALLDEDEGSDATLSALLAEYSPADQPKRDSDQEKLDRALDRARVDIGRLTLTARVEADPDEKSFSLTLSHAGQWPALPEGIQMSCRPVTLPPAASAVVHVGQEVLARFAPVSFESLTAFFAFDVQLRTAGRSSSARFVVNVPLEGAPEDRRERLLRSILKDPAQVLRLIWLLLSETDISVQDWVDAGTGQGGSGDQRRSSDGGLPVLETMLKALDRDPGRLDEVARLITDLRRTPEGAALLPAEFDTIWEPIWKIREGLRT